MGLKIYHCGDLHLGLRFSRHSSEIAEKLREARFSTLERMVAAANAQGCELFVVAGDLFDNLKVAARDVARASQILSRFDRVVALLPGNHDFHAGAADDFWRNFPLPEHGRLLLLKDYAPVSLAEFGIDAVLYPSHCHEKHSSSGNALGWLAKAERVPARYQIGIAHGSFEGLSPDLEGDYFPMTSRELLGYQLDLWLLGHIHVPYPVKPSAGHKIFYPGTHEPDGADCRHEGRAWLLEIQEDKSISAQSLSTGQFRFLDEVVELRSIAELETAVARLSSDGARLLLRLWLKGTMPKAEFEKIAPLMETLRGKVMSLATDFSGLSVALMPEDVDRDFPRGSFSHRLLSELLIQEGDREALQVAFELLQEAEQ